MCQHGVRLLMIFLLVCFAVVLVQSIEEQEKETELKQKIEAVEKEIGDVKRQMESSKKEADREIRRLRREIDKKNSNVKNSESEFKAKETEVNQLRAKLDEVQRELLILNAKSTNTEFKNIIASVLKNFEKYLDPHVALAFEATREKMQSLLNAANDHSSIQDVETIGSFTLFGTLMAYGMFYVPLTCCFYGIFRISAKLRLRHYVLLGNVFCLSFYLLTLLLHVLMGESPFESFRINDQNSVIILAIFICFICALTCALIILALLKSNDLREALFYGLIFPLNFSLSLSLRNRLYYPIVQHEPFELNIMFLTTTCIIYACEVLVQYFVHLKVKQPNVLFSLSNIEEGEYYNSNGASSLKKVLTPKVD